MTRFEKTTNVLLDAFLNGTLAKGDCKACAVGNLVADAQNGKVRLINDSYNSLESYCTTNNHFWSDYFCTNYNEQSKYYLKDEFTNLTGIKNLEKLTDYSIEELAQIEYLFETNTKISIQFYCQRSKEEIAQDQLNGLTAVLNYLATLEENPSTNYMEEFKNHKDLVNV